MDEAEIVRLYSKQYDGAFYSAIGSALEYGLPEEIETIKNAFPEWWSRCLANTKLLEERGIPLAERG